MRTQWAVRPRRRCRAAPYIDRNHGAWTAIHELQHTRQVTLNIGRKQRGVGGDLPGVAALLPAYRMPAGRPHEVSVGLRFVPS